MAFSIGNRLKGYFKRLAIHYKSQGNLAGLSIIETGYASINEGISFDNWNDGTTGHGLTIYLPESTLRELGSLKKQKALSELLRTDLNECNTLRNEFIEELNLDLFQSDNPDCIASKKLFDSRKTDVNLGSIWTRGYFRLFISHRDIYKVLVSGLADELKKYGISCFVAHENIEPLTDWPDEIEKALFSMDALLAVITNDFHEGYWTDQEVGFALGRGVPVIPLKVAQQNPQGLISQIQALKADLNQPREAATIVFERIANSMEKSPDIKNAAVETLVNAGNFDESIFAVKNLLPRFSKLDSRDLQRITEAFKNNSQLYDCVVVRKHLPALLKQHFKDSFQITGNIISRQNATKDELPF